MLLCLGGGHSVLTTVPGAFWVKNGSHKFLAAPETIVRLPFLMLPSQTARFYSTDRVYA